MYFYIAVALTSLALFLLQLGLRFPGFLRFQAQQLRRRLQGKPWLETPWREFDTHVHIERRDKWGGRVYNPYQQHSATFELDPCRCGPPPTAPSLPERAIRCLRRPPARRSNLPASTQGMVSRSGKVSSSRSQLQYWMQSNMAA